MSNLDVVMTQFLNHKIVEKKETTKPKYGRKKEIPTNIMIRLYGENTFRRVMTTDNDDRLFITYEGRRKYIRSSQLE